MMNITMKCDICGRCQPIKMEVGDKFEDVAPFCNSMGWQAKEGVRSTDMDAICFKCAVAEFSEDSPNV